MLLSGSKGSKSTNVSVWSARTHQIHFLDKFCLFLRHICRQWCRIGIRNTIAKMKPFGRTGANMVLSNPIWMHAQSKWTAFSLHISHCTVSVITSQGDEGWKSLTVGHFFFFIFENIGKYTGQAFWGQPAPLSRARPSVLMQSSVDSTEH